MIRLANICKHYLLGEVVLSILKGVTLHIAPGEFVAIMGPSGSGKSTLLNIIGCLDVANNGAYHLDEIPVTHLVDDELSNIRRTKLGFVFQMYNLIPRISALRNVELPLVYAGIAPQERKRRAFEALERVNLADRAGHIPAQLSGGQQQRVAIARALVNEPSVIIADEPTGSLDSVVSAEIMDVFTTLHGQGKTIIMVTHEENIAGYAQRILRLRDGRLESDEKR
jgi:putative ABC transport system ATP-binding protein